MELLAISLPRIDPYVDVRVVGVAVYCGHSPRLGHRLIEELACHLQRAGGVDLALERDHSAVVRSGLPLSVAVLGTFDVLPHLRVGV